MLRSENMSQTDLVALPQSPPSPGSQKYLPPFALYTLRAVIAFGLLLLLAELVITGSILFILIAMLFLGTAIFLPTLYRSTVKQIRHLHAFQEKGRLYRLLSCRAGRIVLWCLYCLVVSLITLVELHTYHFLEWLLFMATIPLFYAVYRMVYFFVRREMRPYLVTTFALTWACYLCPIVMVLLYSAVFVLFGDLPTYESLQAAVTAQKQAVADLGQSALVWEIGQILAFFRGAKMFVLSSSFSASSIIPLALFSLGSWVIFFNACSILSGFLIPRQEYLRIFAPLSDAPSPGPVPRRTIGMTSGIFCFLVLFLFVPGMAYLDAQLAQIPAVSEARKNFEQASIDYVEVIGDSFYEPGTIKKVEQARMQALHEAEKSSAQVQSLLDRYFDQMEGNVDAYLDWYYSLVGEYARISKMLTGEIREYMQNKLVQHLQQGAKAQEINRKLEQALAQHRQLIEKYEQTREQILSQKQTTEPQTAYRVSRQRRLKNIMAPLSHEDTITFGTRLGASGAAGGVSGVVAGMVGKKILAKKSTQTALKLAAKKLAKVVMTKVAGTAGGAASGAAAGGALGSVVPGVGTAIGAAIGGAAGGLLLGVSVDAMLIQLEEAVSREEFKAKLMQAIEQTRQEMHVDPV